MEMIKLRSGEMIPLEMHKVRIVQKLNMIPASERLIGMKEAGCNTFLLENKNVFLDMLTDSGVNAMSDNQLAAMMKADDSYAGSETFYRLQASLQRIFGKKHFLPTHQGRACENIISQILVKPGNVVLMNYHFTTAKSHVTQNGGKTIELFIDEAVKVVSDCPFKGNMDLDKLTSAMQEHRGNIAFVRMEAGTNLIGGQPFSLNNLEGVSRICRENGVPLVLDASLLMDNLHFIKVREPAAAGMEIREISLRIAELCDIVYFSGRKLGFAKGGGIVTSDDGLFEAMRPLVPLFEGFLTYGGMSVREMEAMAIGLDETMDEDVISQGPMFIEFMCNELEKNGVQVVTPPGGLGCHLDAAAFLPHVGQRQYPSSALAAALYITAGIRGMERGTMSEERDENGVEPLADIELLRLALPRRVFTMSQVKFAVDRIAWLHENKNLIGGLEWEEEPKLLRFFFGRLRPIGDWMERLTEAVIAEFGDDGRAISEVADDEIRRPATT